MFKATRWRCAPRLLAFGMLLTMTWSTASAGDGAVYMMTNEEAGNELAVFSRDAHGRLEFPVLYQTGGKGTGGGLGSQGSVAIDADGDTLYVVNAASSTISVFDLSHAEPKLIQVISSSGTFPISITLWGNLLYVLNAGGSQGDADTIDGFRVAESGKLSPLKNSKQHLSATSVLPAQVSFSPNGEYLVVTERDSQKIDVFFVLRDGTAFGPVVSPAYGADSFGFVFDSKGNLVVTEANFGAAPGSVTSYRILEDGAVEPITPSLATGTQLAPCWAAITANGKYVYTANTASASISALELDSGTGVLTLLNPLGPGGLAGQLPAGGKPTDLAILGNQILYVNVAGTGQIAAFTIEHDGSLSELFLSPEGVLPINANGLVVR